MCYLRKTVLFTLLFLGLGQTSKAQYISAQVFSFKDTISPDSIISFHHGDVIYYESYDENSSIAKINGYLAKTKENKELHQMASKSPHNSFFTLGNKVYHGHNDSTEFKFKVVEFDGMTRTNIFEPTFEVKRSDDLYVGSKSHMFFIGSRPSQLEDGIFSFNSNSGLTKLVTQQPYDVYRRFYHILGTVGDSVIVQQRHDLLIGSTFDNMGHHTEKNIYRSVGNTKETFFVDASNRISYMKTGAKEPELFDSLLGKQTFFSFQKIGEHLILNSWNFSAQILTFYLLESSNGKLIQLGELPLHSMVNKRFYPYGKHQMVAFMESGDIVTYNIKKKESIRIEPSDYLLSRISPRYTPVTDTKNGKLYYFAHNDNTDQYYLCALSNAGKDVNYESSAFNLRASLVYKEQPLMYVDERIFYFSSLEGGSALNTFTRNAFNLTFNCFNDANADGIKDPGETAIDLLDLDISGFSLSLRSNANGQIQTALAMDDYTIVPKTLDGWRLTTASAIELKKDLASNLLGYSHTYDIGITPKKLHYKVDGVLSSLPMRCGFDVWLRPKLLNTGTRRFNGECRISIDTLIKLDSTAFDDQPDSIIGNEYVWLYNDIDATQFEAQRIRFTAPGTQFRGTVLKFVTTYRGYGDSNEVVELIDTFKPEVNCAYDPNDKTVWPNREDLDNQTIFDERLTYRIRFQNTGTDTAFNIVIEDTLSQYLDLSTFKLMDYSHKVETQFYDDGLVKFMFNDVLLPDSNINEPESHGFINYTVKAKKGLDEWTEIKNTAHIYFDFNPAIVTNTTSNNMVSEITYISVGKARTNNSIIVFPNPAHNQLNLVLDNEGAVAITVVTSNGVRVLHNAEVHNGPLDVSALNPGVYFISIVQNEQVHRASFVKR